MVSAARDATVGWKCDAASIGYSGIVVHGRPIIEPCHLGSSWQEEPKYLIKSDKTDHLAMHKGATLQKISKSDRSSQKRLAHPKKK